MPTGQVYATNVPQTFLSSQINASTTTVPVTSSSGWPSPPFTAILDIANSNQEPIDVTAVAGTNWTVTRAIDGTTGFAHGINATVTHGDIGRDFREARAHIDASTSNDSTGHSVHGLGASSSVVGTADPQTLTNKTLAGPLFTGGAGMGSGNWSGTGILQESALAFSGITGATFQTTRIVGTVSTGAAPASGTFSLGDMVYDTFYRMFWVCTSAGSPGTWLPMGGVATQSQTAIGTLSVPAWANTIKLAWSVRSTAAGTSGAFLNMQINADSGSNYIWQAIEANGATAVAENAGAAVTSMRIGLSPTAGHTTGIFASGELVITNAQAAIFKTASSHFGAPFSATSGWAGSIGGVWQSTSAITSLGFLLSAGSFLGGSTMTAEFSN